MYMSVVNSGCTATYVKGNEDCRADCSALNEDLLEKKLREVCWQDTVKFLGH